MGEVNAQEKHLQRNIPDLGWFPNKHKHANVIANRLVAVATSRFIFPNNRKGHVPKSMSFAPAKPRSATPVASNLLARLSRGPGEAYPQISDLFLCGESASRLEAIASTSRSVFHLRCVRHASNQSPVSTGRAVFRPALGAWDKEGRPDQRFILLISTAN